VEGVSWSFHQIKGPHAEDDGAVRVRKGCGRMAGCQSSNDCFWQIVLQNSQNAGRRAHGSENLRPVPQKDFCNTIGTFETCRMTLRMSARAFSSEVETGSREENASKQK
jgi:hypothetical protein